ncbi:MAG: cysteine desulfurase [Labilithrix sp.]|nr:cysteine desulfurase [Labilithrix sp.]MCW5816614.1 cysteine desulfurase [Labilithrix sp.]
MPYLDWNATTPPHPDVLAAMRAASERAWANPSSVHAHGRAARAVVEDARAAVAALTGTDARDVVFTAGGTEANNLALRSLAHGGTLVTSRLEHPSITRVAEALEREGGAIVRWLAVRDGAIDLEDLDRALAEPRGPTLVTVQAVNHETGIVQPVAETIARARAANARVHVDAVQGWGKLEVPSGWDTASIAPHKMRGPKGIGALACREGVKVASLLLGGSQEKGVRPGTVDAALAAGFGHAAEIARTSPARWAALAPLRDRLEAELVRLGARSVSHGKPRAPHVVSTTWPAWTGAELVAALDLEGVSVSSGAACSAGTVEPSPVLLAMFDPDTAKRGLRLSLGDTTTEKDITLTLAAFTHITARP